MRRPGLLIGLLIVATVLVDLVALSVVVSSRQSLGFHLATTVICLLPMAQVSLVALWAGLAGKSAPWRVIGLVLVIALWSALLAMIADYGRSAGIVAIWTVTLLAQAVALFVPLSVARAVGVRVVWVGDLDSVAEGSTGRSRLQFSLGYLLGWTTAVAVLLGVFKYTVDYSFIPSDLDFWWKLFVLTVSNAAIALAALWALLGTRRLGLRILLFCLTTATVMSTNCWLRGLDFFWVSALLCLVQALWLAGSLWVFRVCGYRVVRRSGNRHRSIPVRAGMPRR